MFRIRKRYGALRSAGEARFKPLVLVLARLAGYSGFQRALSSRHPRARRIRDSEYAKHNFVFAVRPARNQMRVRALLLLLPGPGKHPPLHGRQVLLPGLPGSLRNHRRRIRRRVQMSDEPVRVVFHIDQSSDLVAVFCCAVEHQAIHAGFETEDGAQLARAAGDVCREAISQLGEKGDGVDVTLETYPDRMEVAIHCRGEQLPPIGLDSFAMADSPDAGSPGGLNGLELLSRVDRVLYNTADGIARTTLVKFLPSHR